MEVCLGPSPGLYHVLEEVGAVASLCMVQPEETGI